MILTRIIQFTHFNCSSFIKIKKNNNVDCVKNISEQNGYIPISDSVNGSIGGNIELSSIPINKVKSTNKLNQLNSNWPSVYI